MVSRRALSFVVASQFIGLLTDLTHQRKKHKDRSQATSPPSPPSPPTATTDSASSLGTTSSPESTKSNTDLPSEWTASQDAILVGMKVQSKTWKEIEEALPGKDRKRLKERYRELYAADNKESQGEGSGESDDKQSSKASRKGKVKEGKGQKEKEKKGILKQSQKDQNGQWTHLEGRPVIYVQSGDPVSAEDVGPIPLKA